MKKSLVLLLLCSAFAFGQARNTAGFGGAVTDPQGAAVPGAQVEVVNIDTGAALKTTTDERGEWVLPAMPAGTYRVTITAQGFKKLTLDDILMNAGVPVTANAKLEIGAATETVEVVGGAELVQTSSATLSTTVQTPQVLELPYISRAGMDLFIPSPASRPLARTVTRHQRIALNALNVTLDGINMQDNNYRKDADGFFTVIPARQDSLEEITLTTSAGNADANAQGAATVRFVTKSGTNSYPRQRVRATPQHRLQRQQLFQQHQRPAAQPGDHQSVRRQYRRPDHQEQAGFLHQPRILPLSRHQQ